MKTIHLKKGYSPKISGIPDSQCSKLKEPTVVGMVPERIPFIKPRLLVEEGDNVSMGSPLFEDKRDPRIQFLSPGGGKVERIVFGPRRVIREIAIAIQKEEPVKTFELPSFEQLFRLERESLVSLMLEGGVWPYLRTFPFMDIAGPETNPPEILVRLGDDEPFGPHPGVYLKDREAFFHDGISLLLRLCANVAIHVLDDDLKLPSLPDSVVVRHFKGPYPTGNPGVQLYRTKNASEQNRSWFIDGQDVTQIGEFFRTGRYPVYKVMTLGGALAPVTGHLHTRAGIPLRLLVGNGAKPPSAARMIAGGVFTGYHTAIDSFMGFYQNAVNLIDEGDREEAFGFIRPGYKNPAIPRPFYPFFTVNPFPWTAVSMVRCAPASTAEPAPPSARLIFCLNSR
jgi:Na+-transporting NADH:ubiquinone oxidoreductase subunit A